MSSGMPYRRVMGARGSRVRAVCVPIVLLCGRNAAAQDRPEGSTVNGRFSIEETNDKFAIDSDDAQFTQGLKVRATWDPRWIDSPVTTCLYEPYRRRFHPNRITASFELGQDIFTPDDIS